MSAIEMNWMLLTHSSTAKQEEKREERGSCQTLWETCIKIIGGKECIVIKT